MPRLRLVHIILLTVVWLIFAGGHDARATAQLPDILIYEGIKHTLFSNPLESYYRDKGSPRPKFQAWHTANYRGYVATWEIEGDLLYLKAIRAKIDNRMVDLDYLFPGNPGRVEARWFTGSLRLPYGELLRYVHQGYASVYEYELIITVKGGNVVAQELIDNRGRIHPHK